LVKSELKRGPIKIPDIKSELKKSADFIGWYNWEIESISEDRSIEPFDHHWIEGYCFHDHRINVFIEAQYHQAQQVLYFRIVKFNIKVQYILSKNGVKTMLQRHNQKIVLILKSKDFTKLMNLKTLWELGNQLQETKQYAVYRVLADINLKYCILRPPFFASKYLSSEILQVDQ
jgi:hypothetical protein